jgi:hypothetical protein
MDLTLADVSVFKYILNRWHALAEEWKTEFFEFSTRDLHVEIFTFSECFTVDLRLMGR